MSIRWPLIVQPRPLPPAPPPAAALTSGVMTLSVKDLMSVLKASATTRPTAITINSPCMKKFLKPFNSALSSRPAPAGCPLGATPSRPRPPERAAPAPLGEAEAPGGIRHSVGQRRLEVVMTTVLVGPPVRQGR